MIRPSPPIRAASLAVLLALTGPTLATAGPPKPANHHAAAMHQQQAVNRQQQAALMHQQQAVMRQQQQQAAMMHQQQAAIRRQSTPNQRVAGAPQVAGAPATPAHPAMHNGGGGHQPSGALAGLTNPKYMATGRYSPYRRGPGGRSNGQNNGQLLSALHSTMARLNQADHDYQGHRARAVHELGQAIHTLQPPSRMTGMANPGPARLAGGNGNRAGVGKGQGQRMPQAQSDQHLQAARQTLMTIQTRMSAGGMGASAAHQRVGGHVQRAVQELNTALAIR